MADKDVEISAETLALAEKISDHLSFDKASGTISADDKAFEETLPEDIDLPTVKRSLSAVTDFTIAANYAVGKAGIAGMKANKKLDKVTAVVPVIAHTRANNVNVKVAVERHREGVSPTNGEKWEKWGTLSSSLEVAAVSTKRGNLKTVSQFLSQEAAKELG